MQALALICCWEICRFLCRNARELFAFLVMISMGLFQERLFIVTPRYLLFDSVPECGHEVDIDVFRYFYSLLF